MRRQLFRLARAMETRRGHGRNPTMWPRRVSRRRCDTSATNPENPCAVLVKKTRFSGFVAQSHGGNLRTSSPCLRASVACRGERCCQWLVAAFLIVGLTPLGAQQLLDRIVARVDGNAITLTDVKAAIALGIAGMSAAVGEAAATELLIDRQLMLAEVERFAPPEPSPSAIAVETEVMTARVDGNLGMLTRETGVDEARIREIARDTLRIQGYLNQRFGTAMQLTEDEVLQYYRIHPEEFTLEGRLIPFGEAEPFARQLAAAERRSTTVAQWLRDLRGRARITVVKR